ncbi:hypothetical protein LOC72_05195 [Roseiconus lacunae]|nr:hypothetical protein [Roseiconus lacunae]
MANSNTDAGNWIEIYNDSSTSTGDLGEIEIRLLGTGFPSWPVAVGDLAGIALAPYQFLIVADETGTDPVEFQSYRDAWEVNSVVFSKVFFPPLGSYHSPLASLKVTMTDDAVVVDEVDLGSGGWPSLALNQSIYVDPTKLDENHIGSNWSVSQFPYLPSGASPPSEAQAGTPGSFAAMVPEPSTLITFCCLSLTSCLRRRRHR